MASASSLVRLMVGQDSLCGGDFAQLWGLSPRGEKRDGAQEMMREMKEVLVRLRVLDVQPKDPRFRGIAFAIASALGEVAMVSLADDMGGEVCNRASRRSCTRWGRCDFCHSLRSGRRGRLGSVISPIGRSGP